MIYAIDVDATNDAKSIVFRSVPTLRRGGITPADVDWQSEYTDRIPDDAEYPVEYISRDSVNLWNHPDRFVWMQDHPHHMAIALDRIGWKEATAPPCAVCGHAPQMHTNYGNDGNIRPVITNGPPDCGPCQRLLDRNAHGYQRPKFVPEAYLYVIDRITTDKIDYLQSVVNTETLRADISSRGNFNNPRVTRFVIPYKNLSDAENAQALLKEKKYTIAYVEKYK